MLIDELLFQHARLISNEPAEIRSQQQKLDAAEQEIMWLRSEVALAKALQDLCDDQKLLEKETAERERFEKIVDDRHGQNASREHQHSEVSLLHFSFISPSLTDNVQEADLLEVEAQVLLEQMKQSAAEAKDLRDRLTERVDQWSQEAKVCCELCLCCHSTLMVLYKGSDGLEKKFLVQSLTMAGLARKLVSLR